jgi:hypothetical protein
MLHITKAKGGYMVVNLGLKREVLSTTEVFKKKQSAIENIIAQARYFVCVKGQADSANGALFQDDTLKVPKCFYCYLKFDKIIKRELKGEKPNKIYKPK